MRARAVDVVAAACVLLACMTAASCASPAGGGQRSAAPTTVAAPTTASPSTGPPTTAPSTSVPSGDTSPSTGLPLPTTRPVPAPLDIRVYFLRGDKIDVAHRTVATPQPARTAMTELLAGPTGADRSAGLSTAIPKATTLLGVSIAGGIATVDLSGAFTTGGGSLSMTSRLAQVTFTLTQFPTVRGVAFRVDGKVTTVFGGEGIVVDHVATRASFESVTPAILVESPGRGSTVHSPLRLSGSADVFEAQFQAELTDGAGRKIVAQGMHATAGTGTRGTFDATMAFPSSTRGAVTLTVFDISARDGARIDAVTIPLTVGGG